MCKLYDVCTAATGTVIDRTLHWLHIGDSSQGQQSVHSQSESIQNCLISNARILIGQTSLHMAKIREYDVI